MRQGIHLDESPNPLPEGRVEDDLKSEPDVDDENLSPQDESWQPSAAQLADLKLAHANDGHPSNTDTARMLKLGNAKLEIVQR